MNPRLTKLTSDWKAYVALLTGTAAGISAGTGLVKTATEGIKALQGLPVETKWIVAAIFALVTVLFIVAALSRRSELKDQERFLISADDPNQLVGREEEIKHLAVQCQRHGMVFLTGDSGSGKSALVRAGLAHSLRTGGEPTKGINDLFPLVVDLSGVRWGGGLGLAIARELNRVPLEALTALGAASAPTAEEVFTWIAARPRGAARRLLVILDQFDDYLLANRARFYDKSTLRQSKDLESSNSDWGKLAELLRTESVHLLIVARSEAAVSFPALAFLEDPEIARESLARLEVNLAAPLLDRITGSAPDHPVVSEPEFGWLQLRSRLLRDLERSGGGAVLPIQLAVVLNSLRLVRFLTVGEYERNGGLHGLERLHIQRHADKAAGAARIPLKALIDALRGFVSQDGRKTVQLSRAEFEAALTGSGATPASTENLLRQLEGDKILRRIPGDERQPETILLYHDYLAGGIREAYRQANRWTQLVREQRQAFGEAVGWLQRWRAMLSPTQQARLLWESLRGRFSFGTARGFAMLSVVRWVVPGLVMAACIVSFWGAREYRKYQTAAEVLASIGHNAKLGEEEAGQLRRLAAAGPKAAWYAISQALEGTDKSERASKRVDYLAGVAVGLDPRSVRSDRLGRFVLLPNHSGSNDFRHGLIAPLFEKLNISRATAGELARLVIAELKATTNSYDAACLASTLAALNPKLERNDVLPAGQAIVEKIRNETDGVCLYCWGEALARLSPKLDRTDILPAFQVIVAKMQTAPVEGPMACWIELAKLPAKLSLKLNRTDVLPAFQAIISKMNYHSGVHPSAFGPMLAPLSPKLERNDVLPLVRGLISGIGIPGFILQEVWGGVLAPLGPKLERDDVLPAAQGILHQSTFLDGGGMFSN